MAIALIAAGFLTWRIATSTSRPAYRWVAPAVAVAIAIWLSVGVRGRSLGEVEAFLPPSDVPMFVAGENAPNLQGILNDHRQALASASATNRLVFIDFTGYTCTNCRWMEANMFARPDVSDELSHFVLSRLYTDGEGEMYENQQRFQEERFGTIALPLYAIVDAQGRTVRTFSGLTRSPAAFIAFLRQTS
jgi:thiol:disulfide interchange protein DsbD